MTTLNLARAQSLPRGKRWHICRSLKKMQSPPVPYLEFPQDFRSRRFAFFASHVLGFGDLSQLTNLDRRGEFMSFTYGFSQIGPFEASSSASLSMAFVGGNIDASKEARTTWGLTPCTQSPRYLPTSELLRSFST